MQISSTWLCCYWEFRNPDKWKSYVWKKWEEKDSDKWRIISSMNFGLMALGYIKTCASWEPAGEQKSQILADVWSQHEHSSAKCLMERSRQHGVITTLSQALEDKALKCLKPDNVGSNFSWSLNLFHLFGVAALPDSLWIELMHESITEIVLSVPWLKHTRR